MAKYPAFNRGDRAELNMLYEDVTIADHKEYGSIEDDRCISLLVYLLWDDDGYLYLGNAIDAVSRIRWLVKDYKSWQKNVFTRVVTKGETGNPHLDDVLRRTKQVRRLLKLKNSDPGPLEPSHRGQFLEKMSFEEHRQKGKEYYEEARVLLRKGDYHTGIYLIGEHAGLDLNTAPPKEVLEVRGELEGSNGDGVTG